MSKFCSRLVVATMMPSHLLQDRCPGWKFTISSIWSSLVVYLEATQNEVFITERAGLPCSIMEKWSLQSANLKTSVLFFPHDHFIPVRLLKLMRTPLSSTIMSLPPLLPLLTVGLRSPSSISRHMFLMSETR